MALDREIQLPMREHELTYLFEEDEDIATRYKFTNALGGKWILFIRIGSMNSMWIKSCKLYRQGAFTGIASLMSSTAKFTPRQSTTKLGVIMFHCGPWTNGAKMLSYGKNIVKQLNFYNSIGFISYKSNAQTVQGTQATGNTNNSMYWIPVPKSPDTDVRRYSESSTPAYYGSDDKSPAAFSIEVKQDERDNHSSNVLEHPAEQSLFADQQKSSRLLEYEIRDVLGFGGSGIVFRAYREFDEHEYAIKRIPLSTKKDKLDRVLREVRVLAKLNHMNVVRYYGSWEETHDADWVREHDEPWKKKLRDQCLTESFRTPVADTTTSSSAQTRSSTSDEWPQDETRDIIDRSSDNDPLDLRVQFSESSTSSSYKNEQPEDHHYSTTNSSYIQFEVQDDQLGKSTEGSKAPQSTSNYLYIRMELCERETLKHWLERNTDRPKQTVLKYFLNIVNAVEHIHDKGKIHRDLKPSNIFFELNNELVAKVENFGLGTNIIEDENSEVLDNLSVSATDAVSPNSSGDQHTKNAGTPSYMAPEQRGSGKGTYTYKVDIFSMGLLLFEMLWVMPTTQEKNRTLQDVRRMEFPDGFPEQHPEELALLQMMLHQDPNKRPTSRGIRAQPLLQSLQLPRWVQGIKLEEHFELAFKTEDRMTD